VHLQVSSFFPDPAKDRLDYFPCLRIVLQHRTGIDMQVTVPIGKYLFKRLLVGIRD